MSEALSSREANSRFRYVEPPFPLPGKCAVCGNVKRPVVDFGASLEFYGAVLICVACVAEAHGVLIRQGLVEVPQTITPAELRATADRLDDGLKSNLDSLTRLLDGYAILVSSSNEQLAKIKSQDTIGFPRESTQGTARTSDETSHDAGDERSSSVSSDNRGGSVFGRV